ncbi:unnamed protein product [Ixodes pacificus]
MHIFLLAFLAVGTVSRRSLQWMICVALSLVASREAKARCQVTEWRTRPWASRYVLLSRGKARWGLPLGGRDMGKLRGRQHPSVRGVTARRRCALSWRALWCRA